MDNQLLISKREAAALLGVSIRTLENLISSKELPARRIGRRCLIEQQVLKQFARRDHATKVEFNALTYADNADIDHEPNNSSTSQQKQP